MFSINYSRPPIPDYQVPRDAGSHQRLFLSSLRTAMGLSSYPLDQSEDQDVIRWLTDDFPFFMREATCRADEIMKVLDDHLLALAENPDTEKPYLEALYGAQVWTAAFTDDSKRIRQLFEEKKLNLEQVDRACWRTVGHERLYIGSPRAAAWTNTVGRSVAWLFGHYGSKKEISYPDLEALLLDKSKSPEDVIRALDFDFEKFPFTRLAYDGGHEHWPLTVYAARFGRLDILELFMQRCPDEGFLHARGPWDKWTLLFHASSRGQLAVVEMLLRKNVDVNPRDGDRRTPLHMAARSGQVDVVKALLDSGKFDINAVDRSGRTALHMAAVYGKTDVVKLLSSRKECDVNALMSTPRATALYLAATSGHSEVVRVLLAHRKVNVNLRDRDELNALHTAVREGHADVLQLLLSSGKCDINAMTKSGLSALHIAASKGRPDLVRQLLYWCANTALRMKDEWKRDAMQLAAEGGHAEVVKVLLLHPFLRIDDVNTQEMRKIGFQLIKLITSREMVAESFYNDKLRSIAATALFYGVDECMLQTEDIDDSRDMLETVFNALVAMNKATVKQLISDIEARSIRLHRTGDKTQIARRSGFLLALANTIGLD